MIAIAAIVFLLTRNLVRGKYGRAFAIVKGNEAVASSMGISPYRYKVLAFTIASLIGGVSGFLYMVVVQYTSPETMSFGHSITLLAVDGDRRRRAASSAPSSAAPTTSSPRS